MQNSRKALLSVLTLIVVIIWGTTFASSKVLMDHGLDTVDILLVSFIIAYVSALIISFKKMWCDNIKDELIHLLCGLIGGAGYYLTQVEALKYTLTTNVSILTSTTPIITAILAYFLFKERFNKLMIVGTLIALLGAVLVVFNGNFELDIDLTGNILSILAAVSWAVYGIFLKILGDKYSMIFTIRKVFFYGTLGILVYSLFHPTHLNLDMFSNIVITGNLIYLGLVSNLICFILWGMAVNEIGPTKTANFMYVQPFATLFVGYLLLNELISPMSILGLILIIVGVYLTERVSNKKVDIV